MKLRSLILALWCLWLASGSAFANTVVHSKHSAAELVTEQTSIQPGQTLWVALRLKSEPSWHTYWRNPGDSGLATTMHWLLPKAFEAGAIQWPYPHKIAVPPLATYGYEGEVFLLTAIKVPATLKVGNKVTFAAQVEWLECAAICLPGAADLQLTLPVLSTAGMPTAWANALEQTRAQLPLANAGWQFAATQNGEHIVLTAVRPTWFRGEVSRAEFFAENDLIAAAAPQKFTSTTTGFTLELQRAANPAASPKTLQGVMVTPDGWRTAGSERAVSLTTAITPSSALGFLPALGLAFVGGLLLNLMPCVLPVLSLKVLGFVAQARQDQSKVWQHGAIFTAGVLSSLWALVGVLLVLRAGGEQLGWGFQLQSPQFLVGLSVFLFLFGLNLFGVFEVGTSFSRAGEIVPEQGLGGSFLSGVVATVVATPCSAPFMGSALGYALTQPTGVALAVFTALGLGMASPYVLLANSPALLKFVPKPGAWMETFKQAMGFLILTTVVWLAWVLGVQSGANALSGLLLALLLASVGAWIFGRWGNFLQPQPVKLIAIGLALSFLGGGLALAWGQIPGATATKLSKTEVSSSVWEPYSGERLAQLRASGKPVFVDFTAAWCLSCQVNKRVALQNPEVQAAFSKQGITLLEADWTQRDATITQALAEFGRSGVPLYLLYGGKSAPEILPEILTPALVLEAVSKLKAKLS